MFRLALRVTGIALLAGAFVSLVVDGTRSIAAGEWAMSALGDQLQTLLGAKFAALQPLVERNLSPLLWDPLMTRLFLAPTWLILGILGSMLVLAARRREATIGYAARP